MGLKNPTGVALAEKYIYVKDPELASRIEALEEELRMERSKKQEVVETVREIAEPVNVELLEKYKAARQEADALKAAPVSLAIAPEPQVEVRTEFKEIERVITKVMVRKDWRLVLAASIASAVVAGSVGARFF